jgi:hypothetical protein
MQAHLARGLSAAEAARVALSEERTKTSPDISGAADGENLASFAQALAQSLDEFDEEGHKRHLTGCSQASPSRLFSETW